MDVVEEKEGTPFLWSIGVQTIENCFWFVFTAFVFSTVFYIHFSFLNDCKFSKTLLSVLENLCREKAKKNCRLIGHREVCFNQITQIWVATCHYYGIFALVRCHFLGTPVVASWSVGCYLRLRANKLFRDSTSPSYIKILHNVFTGHLQSCLPWLATDQGDECKMMDVRGSDRRKLMKLTLLDAEKE